MLEVDVMSNHFIAQVRSRLDSRYRNSIQDVVERGATAYERGFEDALNPVEVRYSERIERAQITNPREIPVHVAMCEIEMERVYADFMSSQDPRVDTRLAQLRDRTFNQLETVLRTGDYHRANRIMERHHRQDARIRGLPREGRFSPWIRYAGGVALAALIGGGIYLSTTTKKAADIPHVMCKIPDYSATLTLDEISLRKLRDVNWPENVRPDSHLVLTAFTDDDGDGIRDDNEEYYKLMLFASPWPLTPQDERLREIGRNLKAGKRFTVSSREVAKARVRGDIKVPPVETAYIGGECFVKVSPEHISIVDVEDL
jgi:hypothetical protein